MKSYYKNDSSNFENNVNVNFVYKPNFPMHDHDYWECFICMGGSFEQVFNDKVMVFKRFDAILIRPSDHHSIKALSENSWHINIMFKEDFILNLINSLSDKLLSKFCAYHSIPFRLDDVEMSAVMDYVMLLNQNLELLLDDRTLVSNLLIMKILNIIINNYKIVVSNRPEWLVELIRKINLKENMWWSAKEVIQEASFSHSHLNRIFQEYFGCSITKYLTSVKVNFTKDCLIHSYMNIKQISKLLGFNSISHLNHIFKEQTGMSPLQYRKKGRENRVG